MREDVITNNFAGNVDRNIIKRNFTLAKVLLIFLAIYVFGNFLYWYIYIRDIKDVPHTIFIFFLFKIEPLVFLFQILLQFIGWSFYSRSQKLFLAAFENEDAGLFNDGYSLVYRLNVLNIVSFGIAILTIVFRFILHNKV